MSGMMTFMESQPKWLKLLIGFIIVVFIGYLDFLTGDYSLLVFYLLPVSLVSWFVGPLRGALIAISCGAARLFADYPQFTNKRLLYWNAVEDMIFLVIVAFLIALLRKALESDNNA
jgi:hypothetical protein